jgi:hypothetical protein
MLLHSQLPLDAVLEAMLDRAITVTDAERGLLLEVTGSGPLKQRLARRAGGTSMHAEAISPTQTVLRMAIDSHTGVITGDLQQADAAFRGAESIIAQKLRSVVAIPLYTMPRAAPRSMINVQRGEFLGISISIRGALGVFKPTARSSTRLPSRRPASWTTPASSSTSANGSASSRNSASHGKFSKRCCRAASAIFRTSRFPVSTRPATRSAETTSTCFDWRITARHS